MTNTLRTITEEEMPLLHLNINFLRRPFMLLGTLCIVLGVAYIASVRMVEASEYSLRAAMHTRDTVLRQYGDLGRELDSLRSLSAISQSSVLTGFQEAQKPMYLNMDAAQSVAVAGKKGAQ